MNIIEQKLRDYRPSTPAEQEVALVEIVQQLILFGLARTAFFAGAAFHGGTCLRILFGMRRFSEDLDFVLKAPADRFSWETYFPAILTECRAFGVELEIKDRKKTTCAVKSAFLKTDSIGRKYGDIILKCRRGAWRHGGGNRNQVLREVNGSRSSCTRGRSGEFIGMPVFGKWRK